MVKKLNLRISGGSADNESAYRDFTKSYRQSDNIVDQRDGKGEARYMQQVQEEIDSMLGGGKHQDRLPTNTRKVDAEEAVRKTHFERK